MKKTKLILRIKKHWKILFFFVSLFFASIFLFSLSTSSPNRQEANNQVQVSINKDALTITDFDYNSAVSAMNASSFDVNTPLFNLAKDYRPTNPSENGLSSSEVITKIKSENIGSLKPAFFKNLVNFDSQNAQNGWTLNLHASNWENVDLSTYSFLNVLKNVTKLRINIDSSQGGTSNSLATNYSLNSLPKIYWSTSFEKLTSFELSSSQELSSLIRRPSIKISDLKCFDNLINLETINISSLVFQNTNVSVFTMIDPLSSSWFTSQNKGFALLVPKSIINPTDTQSTNSLDFDTTIPSYNKWIKKTQPSIRRPTNSNHNPIKLIDSDPQKPKEVTAFIYNSIWYWAFDDETILGKIAWSKTDNTVSPNVVIFSTIDPKTFPNNLGDGFDNISIVPQSAMYPKGYNKAMFGSVAIKPPVTHAIADLNITNEHDYQSWLNVNTKFTINGISGKYTVKNSYITPSIDNSGISFSTSKLGSLTFFRDIKDVSVVDFNDGITSTMPDGWPQADIRPWSEKKWVDDTGNDPRITTSPAPAIANSGMPIPKDDSSKLVINNSEISSFLGDDLSTPQVGGEWMWDFASVDLNTLASIRFTIVYPGTSGANGTVAQKSEAFSDENKMIDYLMDQMSNKGSTANIDFHVVSTTWNTTGNTSSNNTNLENSLKQKKHPPVETGMILNKSIAEDIFKVNSPNIIQKKAFVDDQQYDYVIRDGRVFIDYTGGGVITYAWDIMGKDPNGNAIVSDTKYYTSYDKLMLAHGVDQNGQKVPAEYTWTISSSVENVPSAYTLFEPSYSDFIRQKSFFIFYDSDSKSLRFFAKLINGKLLWHIDESDETTFSALQKKVSDLVKFVWIDSVTGEYSFYETLPATDSNGNLYDSKNGQFSEVKNSTLVNLDFSNNENPQNVSEIVGKDPLNFYDQTTFEKYKKQIIMFDNKYFNFKIIDSVIYFENVFKNALIFNGDQVNPVYLTYFDNQYPLEKKNFISKIDNIKEEEVSNTTSVAITDSAQQPTDFSKIIWFESDETSKNVRIPNIADPLLGNESINFIDNDGKQIEKIIAIQVKNDAGVYSWYWKEPSKLDNVQYCFTVQGHNEKYYSPTYSSEIVKKVAEAAGGDVPVKNVLVSNVDLNFRHYPVQNKVVFEHKITDNRVVYGVIIGTFAVTSITGIAIAIYVKSRFSKKGGK